MTSEVSRDKKFLAARLPVRWRERLLRAQNALGGQGLSALVRSALAEVALARQRVEIRQPYYSDTEELENKDFYLRVSQQFKTAVVEVAMREGLPVAELIRQAVARKLTEVEERLQ